MARLLTAEANLPVRARYRSSTMIIHILTLAVIMVLGARVLGYAITFVNETIVRKTPCLCTEVAGLD